MRSFCGFALDWTVTWMLRILAVVSITLGGAVASLAVPAPMTVQTPDLEGGRYRLEGSTLTLSFPSGNRMVFTRSSR